jgi:hypothetical protein
MDDAEVEIAHEQVIPDISPGALLEVMENPDAFSEIARADLYVQMASMRVQMRDSDVPKGTRMEYMKFLARMGKVAEPDRGDLSLTNLPLIQISLPGSGRGVSISAAPQTRVEKDVTPEDNGFGSGGGLQTVAEIP